MASNFWAPYAQFKLRLTKFSIVLHLGKRLVIRGLTAVPTQWSRQPLDHQLIVTFCSLLIKVGTCGMKTLVIDIIQCFDIPFSALTLLVGRREGKGIRPVKNWMLVCWW